MSKRVLIDFLQKVGKGIVKEVSKNAPNVVYGVYDKDKKTQKMLEEHQKNEDSRDFKALNIGENITNSSLLNQIPSNQPDLNNKRNVSILDKLDKDENGQYKVLLPKKRQHSDDHLSVK